jgi:hypothetical protein
VSTRLINIGKASGATASKTRDFYLACFLRCTGYDLIDLRTEGHRKIFVFRARPTRRDYVLAFYVDGASVGPLSVSSTIMEIKAPLHNA